MLPRTILLLISLLVLPNFAIAQEATENQAPSASVEPVSMTQTATAIVESAAPDDSSNTVESAAPEPEPAEPFRLPAQHHAWARFKPGAWREIQTMSATLDDAGNIADQSFTTQKETLDAVADGKYVLKVQTTLEVGGKQIIGKETTRVLHIETNGAGIVSETIRTEDQSLSLTGRNLLCQVWELYYQDGDRSRRDVVHYAADRFPYILQRETLAAKAMPADPQPAASTQPTDTETPDGKGKQSTDAPPEPTLGPIEQNVERTVEVIALETPYIFNEQILTCTSMRTVRQRAKGGSVRLATINREIPGGELLVTATEFDAEGDSVRFSKTTLLGYGGDLIDDLPAEQPPLPESASDKAVSGEPSEQ